MRLKSDVIYSLAQNVMFWLFQGVLRLNVISARDLRRADMWFFGKSDPYCKVAGLFGNWLT